MDHRSEHYGQSQNQNPLSINENIFKVHSFWSMHLPSEHHGEQHKEYNILTLGWHDQLIGNET